MTKATKKVDVIIKQVDFFRIDAILWAMRSKDMVKKVVDTVVIETFDDYELDGTIEQVIKNLQYYEAEGKKLGLTNIRVSSDYVDEAIYEYGGYQGNTERKWVTEIKGDKDAI